MMSVDDKGCKERIGDQLAGRLAMFDDIEARQQSDDDDVADAARDEQYEAPLSVDVLRMVKVLLSTGGPADWFELTWGPGDDDDEPSRITYHFSDWFDHAERALEGDEYAAAWSFFAPLVGAE